MGKMDEVNTKRIGRNGKFRKNVSKNFNSQIVRLEI